MATNRKADFLDDKVTIGWLIDVLKVYSQFIDPSVAEAIVQTAIETVSRSDFDEVLEELDIDREFGYDDGLEEDD